MSKRIGLSPTATVERLLKGKPTWFVGPSEFLVVEYPHGWFQEKMDFTTYHDVVHSIKQEQSIGYRDFATLEEAEKYAARRRGKGAKP